MQVYKVYYLFTNVMKGRLLDQFCSRGCQARVVDKQYEGR